MKLLSLKR